jgi:hypothetical protein
MKDKSTYPIMPINIIKQMALKAPIVKGSSLLARVYSPATT